MQTLLFVFDNMRTVSGYLRNSQDCTRWSLTHKLRLITHLVETGCSLGCSYASLAGSYHRDIVAPPLAVVSLASRLVAKGAHNCTAVDYLK